jgi:hypothetical protein
LFVLAVCCRSCRRFGMFMLTLLFMLAVTQVVSMPIGSLILFACLFVAVAIPTLGSVLLHRCPVPKPCRHLGRLGCWDEVYQRRWVHGAHDLTETLEQAHFRWWPAGRCDSFRYSSAFAQSHPVCPHRQSRGVPPCDSTLFVVCLTSVCFVPQLSLVLPCFASCGTTNLFARMHSHCQINCGWG